MVSSNRGSFIDGLIYRVGRDGLFASRRVASGRVVFVRCVKRRSTPTEKKMFALGGDSTWYRERAT